MKFVSYLVADIKKFGYLVKKHAIVVVLAVLSYVATYGLNFYLAKMLEPADYGNIAVVLQILAFSVPVVLMGSEIALVRYIPRYEAEGKYELISGFLIWMRRIFIRVSVGIVLIGTILMIILAIFGRGDSHWLERFHIVLYAYWVIPLFAGAKLLSQIFQVIRRPYLSTAFAGVALTLLILGMIGVFTPLFESSWVGNYRTTFSVLLCIGIACVLTIALELFLLKKCMPAKFYKAKPEFHAKHWSNTAFAMMSSTVAFGALTAIDIIMLEILGKNEAQVAHFAAISVIATALGVFASAVGVLVNPMISPCIESDNHKHLQSVLHVMNFFKSAPGLIIAVLAVVFGKDLLHHFGPDYVDAYPALVMMTIGFFVGLCFSSSGPLLIYSHHHRLNMQISIGQLAFIVLMDLIFIPDYGLDGAVGVLIASIGVSVVLRAYFARKYLKIHSFYFI